MMSKLITFALASEGVVRSVMYGLYGHSGIDEILNDVSLFNFCHFGYGFCHVAPEVFLFLGFDAFC